ncbi:membrane metalloprotease [Lacinutrix sp. MEBiC02404]
MKKIVFVLSFLLTIVACTTDDSSNIESNNNNNNTSANQQSTGSSSNDLLSDATYTSMKIELVYVDGFEPSQTAINNFVAFLEARTFKPNGILVEKRAIASPGNSPYTNAEIRAVEDANRTAYNTADQIAVWAFFADGESDSNTNNGVVLGTAYRNTSFVIYEETLHGFSDSAFEPSRSLLETTVIMHEFGHILGLTNLGADLQSNHEDAEHPKHCDVETCLMYWSAETGDGIANLVSGGSAPQLDAQCIADLQANGGK